MAKANRIPTDVLGFILIAYPLANGFSRIMGGWMSDRIGRQITAALFYALTGVIMVALSLTVSNPIGFTFFIVLTVLFAGAVFAFNPAFIGDFYGSKYSTTNYGITYTAKSWGGLFSGYVTAWLLTMLGSYTYLIAGLGVGALISAILVNPWILKKPRKRNGKVP